MAPCQIPLTPSLANFFVPAPVVRVVVSHRVGSRLFGSGKVVNWKFQRIGNDFIRTQRDKCLGVQIVIRRLSSGVFDLSLLAPDFDLNPSRKERIAEGTQDRHRHGAVVANLGNDKNAVLGCQAC